MRTSERPHGYRMTGYSLFRKFSNEGVFLREATDLRIGADPARSRARARPQRRLLV